MALVLTAMAPMAAAQESVEGQAGTDTPTIIEGPALVLDGDTIRIGDQRIRLFGIDAPEMSVWPRGPQARAALDGLIGGQPMRFVQRDTDRYSRAVAVCGTNAIADVSESMLRGGHATVYRVIVAGSDLEPVYEAAKGDTKGVWQSTTVATAPLRPWFERHQIFMASLIALAAAIISAMALRWSAHRQFDATVESAKIHTTSAERRDERQNRRRQQAYLTALAADATGLVVRFNSWDTTSKDTAENNPAGSDNASLYIVEVPDTFTCSWEVMAVLPLSILSRLRFFAIKLQKHNEYMNMALAKPEAYTNTFLREFVAAIANDMEEIDKMIREFAAEFAQDHDNP